MDLIVQDFMELREAYEQQVGHGKGQLLSWKQGPQCNQWYV